MAKKYVSDFVKKQRAWNARIRNYLVWNSEIQGTYIKSKHGPLY